LTVSLARDLREEFHIHFTKFFDILIILLQTQDSDQTEWTLIALAQLFKILKPFLCRELPVVIASIMPLLSEHNQPEHIINFVVECFAFLVKNLRDKNGLLLMILKIVKSDSESLRIGCGKLFYEMIRGLNGQFHSKGEEFLSMLFGFFRKHEYEKYFTVLREVH
jgi:U3 small nucleolar RNA-associated protein 20